MAATLNPALVRAKLLELLTGDPKPLPVDVLSDGSLRLRRSDLPAGGGVYAFFWTGPKDLWRGRVGHVVELAGPGGAAVPIRYSEDWLRLGEEADPEAPIPLYVGKTTNCRKRFSQHVRGKTPVVRENRTTSDQVRGALESLFPDKTREDGRPMLQENVRYQFASLPGESHVVNRFYLENLAIATLQPLFNVDIER